MDVIRSALDVERLVGHSQKQSWVEASVLIPGSGRESVHILLVDALAEVGQVEVQNDTVALDGTLTFQTLYTLGEQARVQALEASCAFSQVLEVPGAGPMMLGEAKVRVEHAEAEYNSGRMQLKAVVSVDTTVTQRQSMEVVSEISVDGPLESKQKQWEYAVIAGRAEVEHLVQDTIEVPQTIESQGLVRLRSFARIEKRMPLQDAVLVSGTATVEVWHDSQVDGIPIAVTRHLLPFEKEVPLLGCTAQSRVLLQAETGGVSAQAEEIGEMKLLRIGALVNIKARLVSYTTVPLIADAYIPSNQTLVLERETVDYITDMQLYTGTDVFKGTVELEEGLAPVNVVLGTQARVAMYELEATGERTVAEGILETFIVYFPVDGIRPTCLVEEIPFRVTFDVALPEEYISSLIVTEAESLVVTSQRLEVRATLQLEVDNAQTQSDVAVIDASIAETPYAPAAGIIMHFVQPGDTLWNVGAHYHLPQQTIAKAAGNDTKTGDCWILYQKLNRA